MIDEAFSSQSHNAITEVSEELFIKTMVETINIIFSQLAWLKDSIDKFVTAENSDKFFAKIFKRHDKDKDEKLSKEG